MKQAILTVGLGFGDEGKGATVDFLVRHYDAELVVRYSGGCQAGHNVELPDGRRHTFSQFGSGTLTPGRPRTFLGPAVIIDPRAALREAEHLEALGVDKPTSLLTIHPRCLVATPWHAALNRLREAARGEGRHGSCGMGVGEARRYWLENGRDAIVASDLWDRAVLCDKLELLRQRALLAAQELLGRAGGDLVRQLSLWGLSTPSVAGELSELSERGALLSAEMPNCETAIFEGAQGVLLDEYRGFHPHTTWSTVTDYHAWELIEQAGASAVAVLGITRTYTTRHGAGPLPTFSRELTQRLVDPGNPSNPWQGSLRCGWLDLPLLRYAAACVGPLDGLVVNHLDQVAPEGWLVCDEYRGMTLELSPAPDLAWQEGRGRGLGEVVPVLSATTPDEIVAQLSKIAPVVLTAWGPTHERRPFAGLGFRVRARGWAEEAPGPSAPPIASAPG